MKKSITKIAPKKLVLRREDIAALTTAQLDQVAGGEAVICSNFTPRSCNPPTDEAED